MPWLLATPKLFEFIIIGTFLSANFSVYDVTYFRFIYEYDMLESINYFIDFRGMKNHITDPTFYLESNFRPSFYGEFISFRILFTIFKL